MTATKNPPPARSGVAVRAMPLTTAAHGEIIRIVRLHGDHPEMRQLSSAGLSVGRTCPVMSRLPDGGVLLGVGARRLAIGGAVAADIWVRLVDVETKRDPQDDPP